MSTLSYLSPTSLCFSLSENGILSLDYEGEHYEPVQITRLFPFQHPEGMLSVSISNEDGNRELGILQEITELPAEQQEKLRGYLRYKYFIPNIEKIGKIEEKLGYVYMEITTELGKKTICIADVTSNLRLVHEKTVNIVDVQGNRYCIQDIHALSRENRQKIEMYI
ncbi:MAG: DUF1854 domain-containing protein [Candidatus Merdivicinus sp.]